MSASSAIYLLLLIGLAIGLALHSRRQALYVVVFLAPWAGLDADVGLRVTAYQIFLAGLLGVSVLRSRIGANLYTRLPGRTALLAFVTFAMVWSVVQVPFLEAASIQGGALRGPVPRAIVQIAVLLFSLSPVLIVPSILRTEREIVSLGRTYLWSLGILAFIGWAQLAVWYATGSNPLPVGAVQTWIGAGDAEREGAYEFSNMFIYRMNSFGGEPKALGASLVVGLLLVQLRMSRPTDGSSMRLLLLWVFLALTTIATFSTTAFLLWGIGSATILLGAPMFKRGTGKLRTVRSSMLLFAAIFAAVLAAEAYGYPILDLIESRTIERVSESDTGVFEDFDDAIKNYLLDHPGAILAGVGLGNVHLYADPYLPADVAVYAGGGVFVAKAEYLRLISELGIVGLILFVAWYIQLVLALRARFSQTRAYSQLSLLVPFGFVSLVTFLAASSTASEFYLVAGAMAAAFGFLRLKGNMGTQDHAIGAT